MTKAPEKDVKPADEEQAPKAKAKVSADEQPTPTQDELNAIRQGVYHTRETKAE